MRRTIWTAAAVAAALALGAGGATLASGAGGHDHGAEKAQGHAHGTQKRALFAVLLGRNELDPETLHKGAGDPNGRGAANVTIDGTTVCFGITVADLNANPVAAHIHKGKRRQNGPIVVPLTPPATGDPGASSGCVQNVDQDLANAIQRHPKRYYVNVHTSTFPGGAIRGQLFGKRR
jgi:CHRD domain